VFWDELYVYPFLNFRLPEITRGLLLYRYRRLSEARAAAREAGYRGAMFPWQSGSDGTEETQVVHLKPAVRAVGTRPQPQPAPRQRGDLLQRMAVLPGHRRPGVPSPVDRAGSAVRRPRAGDPSLPRPRVGSGCG